MDDDNKNLTRRDLVDMKSFPVEQLNSENNYNYCTYGKVGIGKSMIIDEFPFIPSTDRTL